MSPLEAMAKAIDDVITQIYGSPPDKGEGVRMARAALLALAETDLPERVLADGEDAAWPGESMIVYSDGHDGSQEMLDAAFRAMLRAIAEQPS